MSFPAQLSTPPGAEVEESGRDRNLVREAGHNRCSRRAPADPGGPSSRRRLARAGDAGQCPRPAGRGARAAVAHARGRAAPRCAVVSPRASPRRRSRVRVQKDGRATAAPPRGAVAVGAAAPLGRRRARDDAPRPPRADGARGGRRELGPGGAPRRDRRRSRPRRAARKRIRLRDACSSSRSRPTCVMLSRGTVSCSLTICVLLANDRDQGGVLGG